MRKITRQTPSVKNDCVPAEFVVSFLIIYGLSGNQQIPFVREERTLHSVAGSPLRLYRLFHTGIPRPILFLPVFSARDRPAGVACSGDDSRSSGKTRHRILGGDYTERHRSPASCCSGVHEHGFAGWICRRYPVFKKTCPFPIRHFRPLTSKRWNSTFHYSVQSWRNTNATGAKRRRKDTAGLENRNRHTRIYRRSCGCAVGT